ncbi:MAG: hypothetical protein AAB355_00325 [Patescibacteria group bacterium]
MEFKEKYISQFENAQKADASKIVLSNDAYAQCEMLDLLIKKLEHLRLSSMK